MSEIEVRYEKAIANSLRNADDFIDAARFITGTSSDQLTARKLLEQMAEAHRIQATKQQKALDALRAQRGAA